MRSSLSTLVPTIHKYKDLGFLSFRSLVLHQGWDIVAWNSRNPHPSSEGLYILFHKLPQKMLRFQSVPWMINTWGTWSMNLCGLEVRLGSCRLRHHLAAIRQKYRPRDSTYLVSIYAVSAGNQFEQPKLTLSKTLITNRRSTRTYDSRHLIGRPRPWISIEPGAIVSPSLAPLERRHPGSGNGQYQKRDFAPTLTT